MLEFVVLLLFVVVSAQATGKDCFQDYRGVCVPKSVGRCPFSHGGFTWLGCPNKEHICCFPSKELTTQAPTTTTTPHPSEGACGHSYVNGVGSYRIVGGWAAERGEWPWVVSVQIKQAGWDEFMHWCGGVLMDDQWIVTAAHCFSEGATPDNPSQWQVMVGEYDRYREDPGEQAMKVQRIIVHKNFHNPEPKRHDLALIKLASRVKFSTAVQPICLPETADEFVGQVCTVSGWGTDKPYELSYSQTPNEVNLPIMKQDACQSYAAPYYYPTTNLCAGFKHGTQDACGGDSGGPLMCLDDSTSRWKLAGIVSWGTGCAWADNPGVYTKVSAYRDWIRQNKL